MRCKGKRKDERKQKSISLPVILQEKEKREKENFEFILRFLEISPKHIAFGKNEL